MDNLVYDDGFSFHLEPQTEGRALRSVAICDGLPELRFDPSPKTPSLTEEDVAIICKLVSKDERPNFTYHPIDIAHPFYGRQYMVYDPPWLRGTSVGDVLSEVDWKMKCLNIGAQTNKNKSVFWSREKTSKTRGLATYLDFPDDKPDSPGYIYTRCAGVVVQKYDDELVLCGDPKLWFDYYKSAHYSDYITRVLPIIAECDEPIFLKLQEIIKLILSVEWLKKKGIVISKKWMRNAATCIRKAAITVIHRAEANTASVNEVGSTIDISMSEDEKRHAKPLAQNISRAYFGWYDNGSGEMVQFDDGGKCFKEYQSVRTFNKQTVTINGKKVKGGQCLVNFGIYLPAKLRVEDIWKLHNELEELKEHHQLCSPSIGRFSLDIQVEKHTEEKGRDMTVTVEMQLSEPTAYPCIKVTTVIRESTTDWDFIYQGLNPKRPMMPVPDISTSNVPVVPDADSWNELYSQTVPWPRVWLLSPDGNGYQSATGGVRTDVIPTTTEKLRDWEVRRSRDQYSRVVPARLQGSVHLISKQDEVKAVSGQFSTTWNKGPCPKVDCVFGITNFGLEQKWTSYIADLTDKRVETQAKRYFHGTGLMCNIVNTKKLCTDFYCGICGICNEGFSTAHISNDTFQRFGKGFYLAPNSSKSNDYTHGVNNYKALLLCDVCPGNKYILKENDKDLQGPPPGCNSVYGKVGADLNYPEIVLYNPAAIMPRYIIVYT